MTAPVAPIAFFSSVHPHPWAPEKGTFNRVMLESVHAAGCPLTAVVPVPWLERRGPPARIVTSYPVDFPTAVYLPRIAPLALAAQFALSTGSSRRSVQAPRLVLAYWVDPDGTVAADWASSLGVPFVQIVGGSDVLLLGRSPARQRRMLQTLRRAQQIITIGSDLRTRLMEWGVDPSRITSMTRGVDRSVFSPGDRAAARQSLGLPPDSPILLWVGRMVPVKGLDVLLRAMHEPSLAECSPLLIMVGGGPDEQALRQQAQSLPQDRIRFAGQISHAEMPLWYRAADLVVMPSRSEGIPNVLAEALACGTGFVASDVGSVRELVTDPEAELVPPDDAAQLANRLAARLKQPLRVDSGKIPDVRESGARLASILEQLAVARPQPVGAAD